MTPLWHYRRRGDAGASAGLAWIEAALDECVLLASLLVVEWGSAVK